MGKRAAALAVVPLAGIVAATSPGCGRGSGAALHVAWPDAPLQLGDAADRDQAIDAFTAMPYGAARDAARTRIADALATRLGEALDDDHRDAAETLLGQLAELWQDDPAALADQLTSAVPLLHRVRDTFARAGAGEPTIAALAMLAELEPVHRVQDLAEIEEILAFADDLAIAERGQLARGAQPSALLQPTVMVLPLSWLVDRYVELAIARANAIAAVMDAPGGPASAAGSPTGASAGGVAQAVRAQHDVVATSHRVANVLARAGRVAEIHGALDRIHGIGNHDRELAARAEIITDQPTAESYIELARSLRDLAHARDEAAAPDASAALAVCMAGLRRYPNNPELLAAAAEHAQTLGRVDQPIALLEAALRAGSGDDDVTALRLGRLYAERIDRLTAGGRPGAAAAAWRDLDRSRKHVPDAHPQQAWNEALGGAEAALGRGLIADGEVADGERELTAALTHAPSYDAYQSLAELDLQIDHYASATRWVARGMAMLGDSPDDRYRRAKLERVAGDAFHRANRDRDASETYLDALRTWASLGSCDVLPRAICAERMLESGQIEYALGEGGRGIELVQRAVDTDPDTPATVAGAVAFLLEIGRSADAAEAFHRGLGSLDIGEPTKAYASLWMVGDARRRGVPPDRLAADYLASRHGDVWYELLAQAASGHVDLARLRAAATTGPRRVELDFYTATLGLDRSTRAGELYVRVVQAKLVTHAEYDLARAYLAKP